MVWSETRLVSFLFFYLFKTNNSQRLTLLSRTVTHVTIWRGKCFYLYLGSALLFLQQGLVEDGSSDGEEVFFVIYSAVDLSDEAKDRFLPPNTMLVYSSRLSLEEGENHPLLMAICDHARVFNSRWPIYNHKWKLKWPIMHIPQLNVDPNISVYTDERHYIIAGFLLYPMLFKFTLKLLHHVWLEYVIVTCRNHRWNGQDSKINSESYGNNRGDCKDHGSSSGCCLWRVVEYE